MKVALNTESPPERDRLGSKPYVSSPIGAARSVNTPLLHTLRSAQQHKQGDGGIRLSLDLRRGMRERFATAGVFDRVRDQRPRPVVTNL